MIDIDSNRLAAVFSAAIVKPYTSVRDVEDYVNALKKHPFASIAVDLYHLPLLAKLLRGTEIDVCCAIAYPLGGLPKNVKVAQVKWAIDHGADEVDFVMNISAFRTGKYDFVKDEMEAVVKAAEERIVKCILCTMYLKPDEIKKVATMMAETGVSILKTNAGFKQVTKYNDVKIVKKTVENRLCVMPAGGLRNADIALGMINAGADRIDSGTPLDVINSFSTAQKTYTDEELEKIVERIEEMNRLQPKIKRKVYD